MKRWYILSALGKDRPGIVSELARGVLEADANLEDSRMTILGTDFAVMLLCSCSSEESGERLNTAAKRLERELGLVILVHALEGGPRPQVPAAGTGLYRLEAAGEDKAGIVAGICGALAERSVNIVEMSTRAIPGPGGSPHYEMLLTLEVPHWVDHRELRDALESEADRLVVDVSLMPA